MRNQATRNFAGRLAIHSPAVLLLLLMNIVGALIPGGGPRAHASSPAIQITPNSGPYGIVTVVTGHRFAAHEQVAIL